jgi:hypothetical protein
MVLQDRLPSVPTRMLTCGKALTGLVYSSVVVCGSVTFWYGSAPVTYGSGPGPALFINGFQDANKK